jgi:hypothetical protein
MKSQPIKILKIFPLPFKSIQVGVDIYYHELPCLFKRPVEVPNDSTGFKISLVKRLLFAIEAEFIMA